MSLCETENIYKYDKFFSSFILGQIFSFDQQMN
jgi:hypothetical protein